MRIGYLIDAFPTLSETFISREVLSLRRMGQDIIVWAFKRPSSDTLTRYSPEMLALTDDVHYVSNLQVLNELSRSPLRCTRPEVASLNAQIQRAAVMKSNPYARLLRACAVANQAERLAVKHLHAHWPYASQIAALAHRMTGVTYSVSIHAHEVAHDNGHFPIVFQTLAFATFCNRAAMEYALAQLPDECRARSHLIYHGVNIEDFSPSSLPTPYRPLRLLSSGRLTRTKGFGRLVAGCARAHQAGVDLELTVLGDGRLYEELKSQAQKLGFAERLHMPGWVPYSEVHNYLAQAHAFVL